MQGNVCLTWYTPQYIPICKCYFEIKLIYMFISKCLIFAGNHIICVWRFRQLWAFFWNSYINFILYLIQSWTKIVGTLEHNSGFFFFFFRYSIFILPSPPFNVVLLWTRRANCIAYHVWSQHWFRGVGSVKCPSINGQDCRLKVTPNMADPISRNENLP